MDSSERGPMFGDIVRIEQKRHGVQNEFYTYKVVGQLMSNTYRTVPVDSGRPYETQHNEIVPVIHAICCGIDETKVEKFRIVDVERIDQ